MNFKHVAASLLAGLVCMGPAAALPDGAQVINGQVQINQNTSVMQIIQSTQQGIVNWNGFNINVGELVHIMQPNQLAVLLNRVTGQDPSSILGTLRANGQVILVNPNGILFGPNSVVDVGSFMASTLGMSDQDFLNKNYKFTQDPGKVLGAIVNQGTIQVADGGYLVLAAPLIHNDGLIVANHGQVALGATTQATVSFDGKGNLQFAIPQDKSETGTVVMTRDQMSDVLTNVLTAPRVNEASSLVTLADGRMAATGGQGVLLNTGQIHADGTPTHGAGSVLLDSTRATVVSGTVSANAQGPGNGGDVRVLSNGLAALLDTGHLEAKSQQGVGGFVELSGQSFFWQGQVDTSNQYGLSGTFLLDPADVHIVDGNGDIPGSGGTFTGDPNLNQTVGVNQLTNSGSSNVLVTATNSVIIDSLTSNSGIITMPDGQSLTLTADNGAVTFANPSNGIRTNGGSININSGMTDGSVTYTSLLGELTATGGNVVVNAGRFIGGNPIGNPAGIIALAGPVSGSSIVINNNKLAGTIGVNSTVTAAPGGTVTMQAGVFNTTQSVDGTTIKVPAAGGKIDINSLITAPAGATLTAGSSITAANVPVHVRTGPGADLNLQASSVGNATTGDTGLSVDVGGNISLATVSTTADPSRAFAANLAGTVTGGNIKVVMTEQLTPGGSVQKFTPPAGQGQVRFNNVVLSQGNNTQFTPPPASPTPVASPTPNPVPTPVVPPTQPPGPPLEPPPGATPVPTPVPTPIFPVNPVNPVNPPVDVVNLSPGQTATLEQQLAQNNILLGNLPPGSLLNSPLGTLGSGNLGLSSSGFISLYSLSLNSILDEDLLDNFWRHFLEGSVIWEAEDDAKDLK